MLANFLGKSKPVNFLLITVLFVLYTILFFATTNSGNIPRVSVVIGCFVMMFVFFGIFNFIVSKNRLTLDNSFGFLFFVISLGFIPAIIIEYKLLFINLILLMFLRKTYSLRSPTFVFQKLYDSGLWIGVAFLLEPMSLIFVFLLYAAIYLFVELHIRVVLIPLLGIATPIFLFFTYCLYVDQIQLFYNLFDLKVSFDYLFYTTNYYKLTISLFGAFVFFSVASRSLKIFSVSNRFKRIWSLLLLHLILSVLLVLLLETHNGTELLVVCVPVSIIIANWVQHIQRKWLANLVLLTLLGLSFAVHFIV